MTAQELPYYEVPNPPKEITAGTIASRMIDGLGFRYYWATQGLTQKNLQYKPSDKARSIRKTLDHIFGLSSVTLCSLTGEEVKFVNSEHFDFDKLRRKTLNNFKKSSDILKKSNDLSNFTVKLIRNNAQVEYPFWNQINGPIADALWHVGQVVLLRRSAGNPFPKGINLFAGTVSKEK